MVWLLLLATRMLSAALKAVADSRAAKTDIVNLLVIVVSLSFQS
jgi:hypothetical protein